MSYYDDVVKKRRALVRDKKHLDKCASLRNILDNKLYLLKDPDGDNILFKAECRDNTKMTFRHCRDNTKTSTIKGKSAEMTDGLWGEPHAIEWSLNAIYLAHVSGNLRKATKEEVNIWKNLND